MDSVAVTRYKNILQGGQGLPWENAGAIFRGRRGQRGFGLFGTVFNVLKRVARPIAKSLLPVAKSVGKKVARQAWEVGKDILFEGVKPKEALKSRGKQLLTDVIRTDISGQRGSGRKRPRKKSLSHLQEDGELWIPSPRKRKRHTRRLQI